ncbi:hypothetical protein V8E54_003351 [Elaphomyces granulatus]
MFNVSHPGHCGKSHADSEQGFINQGENWSRGLDDYDIELKFCWVTPEPELESGSASPSSRSLRSKEISKPGYKFTRIPLDVVSKDIWKKYDQAIKAREKAAASNAGFALADAGSTWIDCLNTTFSIDYQGHAGPLCYI